MIVALQVPVQLMLIVRGTGEQHGAQQDGAHTGEELRAVQGAPSCTGGYLGLKILILGPGGWSVGRLLGAVTLDFAGDAAGRAAYDVEGHQLCVARVDEDGYVLGPARRRKDGAS
jgi:hypothetical protein